MNDDKHIAPRMRVDAAIAIIAAIAIVAVFVAEGGMKDTAPPRDPVTAWCDYEDGVMVGLRHGLDVVHENSKLPKPRLEGGDYAGRVVFGVTYVNRPSCVFQVERDQLDYECTETGGDALECWMPCSKRAP